jgi:hypothetical protein
VSDAFSIQQCRAGAFRRATFAAASGPAPLRRASSVTARIVPVRRLPRPPLSRLPGSAGCPARPRPRAPPCPQCAGQPQAAASLAKASGQLRRSGLPHYPDGNAYRRALGELTWQRKLGAVA